MAFTVTPPTTKETTAGLIVMPRFFSSARESVRVVPSFYRADLVDDSGGVEQPLGEGGLTGVYMRQDSQVESSHRA